MLNIVWPIFIIISIIFSILLGNVSELNKSIFESTDLTIKLSLTLLGTISLWNGIMQIANQTAIIDKITKIIRPIMKILFPKMQTEEKEYKEISMNIIANILGLGNASTPLRLKSNEISSRKKRK